LTSGLIWLAARRARWWAWPLAGLSLGLGFYSYLPVRLFPLVNSDAKTMVDQLK